MKIGFVRNTGNEPQVVRVLDILPRMEGHMVFDRLSREEKKWLVEWFTAEIDTFLKDYMKGELTTLD